jgi:hypothetical protein
MNDFRPLSLLNYYHNDNIIIDASKITKLSLYNFQLDKNTLKNLGYIVVILIV